MNDMIMTLMNLVIDSCEICSVLTNTPNNFQALPNYLVFQILISSILKLHSSGSCNKLTKIGKLISPGSILTVQSIFIAVRGLTDCVWDRFFFFYGRSRVRFDRFSHGDL